MAGIEPESRSSDIQFRLAFKQDRSYFCRRQQRFLKMFELA